uniref:HDC02997 n=1 Tax=Drosophila melanogaster TaxID=7227 RepID=Q6IH90_DROME|nr:TPA_inf: HDC02997 [Drosophila melanogaster]
MTKKVKTHFSWRALEVDVDCINAGRVDRANHIQISVLFGVNGIMPMGVADAPNAHVPVIYMPVYLPALGGRWLSGHCIILELLLCSRHSKIFGCNFVLLAKSNPTRPASTRICLLDQLGLAFEPFACSFGKQRPTEKQEARDLLGWQE